MNDAFWDCSAAAIAGKRTWFNCRRTAGEKWTIWSGQRTLGRLLSLERGREFPLYLLKESDINQLCAQPGGGGGSLTSIITRYR